MVAFTGKLLAGASLSWVFCDLPLSGVERQAAGAWRTEAASGDKWIEDSQGKSLRIRVFWLNSTKSLRFSAI
jgi:hypothetical protein